MSAVVYFLLLFPLYIFPISSRVWKVRDRRHAKHKSNHITPSPRLPSPSYKIFMRVVACHAWAADQSLIQF